MLLINSALILSKVIVYMDHSTLKFLLSKNDAKPRLIIAHEDCTENLAADHLLRLENPCLEPVKEKWIDDIFPDGLLHFCDVTKDDSPWFAYIANYLVSNVVPIGKPKQQLRKFFIELKYYF